MAVLGMQSVLEDAMAQLLLLEVAVQVVPTVTLKKVLPLMGPLKRKSLRKVLAT